MLWHSKIKVKSSKIEQWKSEILCIPYEISLGRDYTQRSNTHSGQIAYEIDVQVRKIIDACYQEATNIIEQNKESAIFKLIN